ncbi:hypothetical protein, partial [Qaidamihabitans albus]|uniref:hypothetical protein n=1 Tax=Qaidamihabitans albus TaxID=2795733 RepID=UPI001B35494B
IIECAARAEDTSVPHAWTRGENHSTTSLAGPATGRPPNTSQGRPGTGIHVAVAARPRNLHPGTSRACAHELEHCYALTTGDLGK